MIAQHVGRNSQAPTASEQQANLLQLADRDSESLGRWLLGVFKALLHIGRRKAQIVLVVRIERRSCRNQLQQRSVKKRIFPPDSSEHLVAEPIQDRVAELLVPFKQSRAKCLPSQQFSPDHGDERAVSRGRCQLLCQVGVRRTESLLSQGGDAHTVKLL